MNEKQKEDEFLQAIQIRQIILQLWKSYPSFKGQAAWKAEKTFENNTIFRFANWKFLYMKLMKIPSMS